jgi:phage shock protein A
MSKHGIIGRVTQLARANVDAMIDSADDPEQMLDKLVRDYQANIAEAEHAIAQLTGNLGIAEADQREDAAAVGQWTKEAEEASQKADDLRATGEADEADRFDDLARVALERQMIAENDVQTVQHTITAQQESVDKLTNGRDQMTIKLTELVHKRDHPLARSASSRLQIRTRDAARSLDIMDPSSEVAWFEEKVRREEARARGAGGLQASSLDAQFASLADVDNMAQIDERLKALKTGRAMASASAKTHSQAQAQAQAHAEARAQTQAQDQPFR